MKQTYPKPSSKFPPTECKTTIAHKEFKMLGISQHISICGINKTPYFYHPLLQGKKEESGSQKDYGGTFYQDVQAKTEQSFSF